MSQVRRIRPTIWEIPKLEDLFDTQERNIVPENGKIQWHPGFCSAAEIELRLNIDDLQQF